MAIWGGHLTLELPVAKMSGAALSWLANKRGDAVTTISGSEPVPPCSTKAACKACRNAGRHQQGQYVRAGPGLCRPTRRYPRATELEGELIYMCPQVRLPDNAEGSYAAPVLQTPEHDLDAAALVCRLSYLIGTRRDFRPGMRGLIPFSWRASLNQSAS